MGRLYNIPITIADILIELTSPISAVDLRIEQRMGPFYGISKKPRARAALRWVESAEAPVPQGDLIYDPGSGWKMYRAGDDYYAALTYTGEGGIKQKQCVLRGNPAWSDLTLTEQYPGAGWTGSLLNSGAGELILRTAIILTGGLVFHSSGIDDNGRGIVFVGHSGAGKSTQVGLWSGEPGVIAMNDDRIAVRADENGVTCYGTPWGGTADIARNHSAPLTALIVLEQSPENSVKPLTPSAAASLLSARAFLPYWDKGLMQLALSNLTAVLERVPVYRLRCRPEKGVISLVRSVA